MFNIDSYCPICCEGTIGFVLCSDQKTMVLVCDECESTWLDPSNVSPIQVLYPKAPDFKVPGLECSIKAPDARWATREEIMQKGWGHYIADCG